MRPEVQAFFEKVSIETVDTVCPTEPTLSLSDRVCIETDTGTLLDSGEIFETRGSISAPLTTADMRAKFLDCATAAPYVDANALFDRLYALPQLHNMAELV